MTDIIKITFFYYISWCIHKNQERDCLWRIRRLVPSAGAQFDVFEKWAMRNDNEMNCLEIRERDYLDQYNHKTEKKKHKMQTVLCSPITLQWDVFTLKGFYLEKD